MPGLGGASTSVALVSRIGRSTSVHHRPVERGQSIVRGVLRLAADKSADGLATEQNPMHGTLGAPMQEGAAVVPPPPPQSPPSARTHHLSESGSITSDQRKHSSTARTPWYILLPTHPLLKLVWGPVRVLLVVWAVMVVPVLICFDPLGQLHRVERGAPEPQTMVEQLNDGNGAAILVLFVDVLFIVDMLLYFVTAFKSEASREYITDPRQIAVNYISPRRDGMFFVDFVAAFPFDLVMQKGGALTRMSRVMRLARVLRLVRVVKVARAGEHLEWMEDRLSPASARIMKTLIMLFVLTNLLASFWYGVYVIESELNNRLESDEGQTQGWVGVFHYTDASTSDKYIASMYWAFTTLTTVGFGDIHATTAAEQMFSIVTMIIGVTVYAVIISGINSAFVASDARSEIVNRKRRQVREFCRIYNLPNKMRDEMIQYLEHRSSDPGRTMDPDKQQHVLSTLSLGLRKRVILSIYSEIRGELPFFRENPGLSDDFQAAFLPNVEVFRADEEDWICEMDSPAREMFFLVKGRVAFYDRDHTGSQILVGEMRAGEGKQHWGENECRLKALRTQSAQALEACKLYTLSSAAMKELELSHPAEMRQLRKGGLGMGSGGTSRSVMPSTASFVNANIRFKRTGRGSITTMDHIDADFGAQRVHSVAEVHQHPHGHQSHVRSALEVQEALREELRVSTIAHQSCTPPCRGPVSPPPPPPRRSSSSPPHPSEQEMRSAHVRELQKLHETIGQLTTEKEVANV